MVIDAERLAGRTADKNVKLTALETGDTEEIGCGNVLNRTVNKRCLRMIEL
jgi:hypothetical protein